jgi:caffeoyl-CoA O-methyltransferase
MSADNSLVTARHFEYLAERTLEEGAFLRELKSAALAAGIPRIWISPEQAAFMRIMLRLVGARHVVEVGTLAGYSAIQMARALPADGDLRSIEIDAERARFAQEWIARSDVASRVKVLVGDAVEILPTMASGSADAAFIDADKEGYPSYLRECLRIVRTGGLVMVDNAFAFGELFAERPTERSVAAIREFNDRMARIRELESIIVPLGDGCWVGVKVETGVDRG